MTIEMTVVVAEEEDEPHFACSAVKIKATPPKSANSPKWPESSKKRKNPRK